MTRGWKGRRLIQPKSRGPRKPKRSSRGTLTRQHVLSQGLKLLDRDGLQALTMRSLAAYLGVSPMALYNHVEDKEDLLQGIARHLLDGTQFSSASPDWRERIGACFRVLRNLCLAHPDAVRLMETIAVAPLAVFSPMEITLAALENVVKSGEDALCAYFLLINFTLGQVSYETRGPIKSLEVREALEKETLKDAGFPHIERAASQQSWDFTRAFEFGLSIILAGLDAQSKT